MLTCRCFDIDDPLMDDFLAFRQSLYDLKLKPEGIHNKYITKLFVVYNGNTILSRASAILNPVLKYDDQAVGLIGHFESENNLQAVNLLFSEIAEYFKTCNISYLIGPMNATSWHSYRVAEASDEAPVFLDVISKAYYANLFRHNGWQAVAKYLTTSTTNLNIDEQKLEKHFNFFTSKNIQIRPFNINNFQQDLKIIYDISIDSFKGNFLYSEISYEEFSVLYNGIDMIINPEYFLIAEDQNKEPLGFVFCYDNFYEQDIKALVIKSLGRVHRSKARGIGHHLVDMVYKKAKQAGYQKIYHTLMHEDNVSRNINADRHKVYRRYSLFGKAI